MSHGFNRSNILPDYQKITMYHFCLKKDLHGYNTKLHLQLDIYIYIYSGNGWVWWPSTSDMGHQIFLFFFFVIFPFFDTEGYCNFLIIWRDIEVYKNFANWLIIWKDVCTFYSMKLCTFYSMKLQMARPLKAHLVNQMDSCPTDEFSQFMTDFKFRVFFFLNCGNITVSLIYWTMDQLWYDLNTSTSRFHQYLWLIQP